MWIDKLNVITKKRLGVKEFISNDKNSGQQREALMNLFDLMEYYKAMKVMKQDKPPCTYRVKYNGNIAKKDTFRKNLHSLKLALLDKRPYKLDFPIVQCNYKRMDFVFIMAMIQGKADIVYHFLSYGFPGNINSSIFGSKLTPSYFHLACSLNFEILSMFLDYSPSFSLTWNGLTPQIIASFNCFSLYYKQPFDFMTTNQFYYLNIVRNVYLNRDREEPLFLLDFMCMNKHILALKKLLDKNPELAGLTKLCYISQCNLNIIRILTGYQTKPDQEYGGVTPIHIAAFKNNISILVTFLYLKCNINHQDFEGDTPLHVAARRKNYIALELMIRCGGDCSIKNKDGLTPIDITNQQGWIMAKRTFTGPEVLPNIMDMDKDRRMFTNSQIVLDHIVKNRAQAIKKGSRFTITSLLSFSNKETETEQRIQKLYSITPFVPLRYSAEPCYDFFSSLI